MTNRNPSIRSSLFQGSVAARRGTGGFTLIEMVIVVAIVAILAAIAIPAYTDSIRKGRRGQGKTDILEVAQAMERCYTVRNSYNNCWNGFTSNDLAAAGLGNSPSTGTVSYTLGLTNVTRTTFTVIATRVNDQLNDTCGNLGLNHQGVKTVAGGGTVAECW